MKRKSSTHCAEEWLLLSMAILDLQETSIDSTSNNLGSQKMNSELNAQRFPKSPPVDMSSAAISSRLREVSELHQLGLSLMKAKPMANAPNPSTTTFVAQDAPVKSSSVASK
jgi:hypothetical protein